MLTADFARLGVVCSNKPAPLRLGFEHREDGLLDLVRGGSERRTGRAKRTATGAAGGYSHG